MGYSARYHAISLAAVFLALAIGILIGVGFGDDVVSGTAKNLEKSLQSDLEDALDRTDDLRAELGQEREFADRVYPALVGGRLEGQRVALVALGSLSVDLSNDLESALDPSGAKLGEVAVVGTPPNLNALSGALPGRKFQRLRRRPESLADLAMRGGRALVRGGTIFDRLSDELLSRFSGEASGIDAAIIVRDRPDDLKDREASAADRLEGGIIDGIAQTGVEVVGVERSDAEDSSISFFQDHRISTVDSVDLASGSVAMVFALAGAEGSFGIKDTADGLLPDLLGPPALFSSEPEAGGR